MKYAEKLNIWSGKDLDDLKDKMVECRSLESSTASLKITMETLCNGDK